MHILFLSDYFYPEVTAAANRTFEHCRYWVKEGVKVTVITSIPNFPLGIPFDGYQGIDAIEEQIESIRVIRVPTYMAKNEKVVKRSIDYASYGISSFLKGLQVQPDVIVATSPHLIIPGSGLLLAKLWDVPFILEIRDLWPESIAAVGALNKGFMYSLLEKYELFLYKNASTIVCNTNGLVDSIKLKGIDANKLNWIPNGVDELSFGSPSDLELKNWRTKLGLSGKFVISYIGTIGMAHGLDFIVKAASKIDDDSIHFLIVGDGAEKDHIKKIVSQNKRNNITVLPQVSKEVVSNFYELTDAALINLKKNPSFTKHLPSKIFDVCHFGKPILLGIDGEAKDLLHKFDAGIYFKPENESAFLNAVFKMAGDSQLRKRFSNGAKKLAESFNRKTMALKMLDIIKAQFDNN